MPKAVQLAAYGGVDQLQIVDVPKPEPAADDVIVRVVAAGTNPGEISIREGLLKDRYPKEFPFGQGTDFAGHVEAVGANVTAFAPGDAVLGWTEERASQAEYVRSSAERLIRKPEALDWFRAGSLFVAGVTAVAAVRAVALRPDDVVAVSGAAGGVGSFAVQLARRTGARVIGIASAESAPFLRSVGVEPLAYGDGLAARLREAAGKPLDAFVDLFGGGYVELAIGLGVAKERIDTIIDFAAVQKYGVKADGSGAASTREALAYLAEAVAWGDILMPIAAIYPFAQVRDAYVELARRKAHGKIVLALDPSITEPIRPAR
jgi:NADPH:quinone reductase-like Zn-dependent oxidoreductase